MTYRRADATIDAVGDAEGALFDGGTVQFRTGAQPATPDTAASGTLLGTVTLANPAFLGSTGGVNTADTITSDTSADASGTVAHARILDSVAAIIGDASCGSGSGDFDFDNPVVVIGGTIAVTSLTLNTPE